MLPSLSRILTSLTSSWLLRTLIVVSNFIIVRKSESFVLVLVLDFTISPIALKIVLTRLLHDYRRPKLCRIVTESWIHESLDTGSVIDESRFTA
jgi:hypothetical protein